MTKKTKRQKIRKRKVTTTKNRTHTKYLGGNSSYTGKGGENINGENRTIPNTGPPNVDGSIMFKSSMQRGGTCSMCSSGTGTTVMTGGKCNCGLPFFSGGSGGEEREEREERGGSEGNHRQGCKCSICKKTMKGGHAFLTGDAINYNTYSGLPGVDGISGNRNYYDLNTFQNGDVQSSIINVGANSPFIKGGNRKKQKGGNLSNFIGQDLINLGRQFQFGMGSAYNALAGYSPPVNPLPWTGQLVSKIH